MSKEYLAISKKDLEKLRGALDKAGAIVVEATTALDALIGDVEAAPKKPRKKRAPKMVSETPSQRVAPQDPPTEVPLAPQVGNFAAKAQAAGKFTPPAAPSNPAPAKFAKANGGAKPTKGKGNGAMPQIPGHA